MLKQILRKSFGEVSFYFIGQLFSALIFIIAFPIFSRLFLPAEYGVLTIVNLFTSMGIFLCSNWLTSSILRFLPHYKQNHKLANFCASVIFSYLLSLILLVLTSVPLIFLAHAFIDPQVYRLLPLAGLIIAAGGLFAIFQTMLMADQRPKEFVGFGIAKNYGAFVIGILLVLGFGYNIDGILWGTVAMAAITSVGMAWAIFRYHLPLKVTAASLTHIRELAGFGLPMALSGVGAWVLAISDRLLLQHFRGNEEVGLYAMGYALADSTIKLAVTSLILSISPTLVHTWESENRPHTASLVTQFTRLMVILVVPMVVGLATLAHPIYLVFSTTTYLPGAAVIPWVSLGALMYGLSTLAHMGLLLAKRTGLIARNYLLVGVANVLLNFLLIPHYGFMAAAVNTAASYALLLVLSIWSTAKYLPWVFPWRSFLKTALAAAIMGLLVWSWMRLAATDLVNLVLAIFIGAVTYLSVLWGLRELREEERATLKEWLGSALQKIMHPKKK